MAKSALNAWTFSDKMDGTIIFSKQNSRVKHSDNCQYYKFHVTRAANDSGLETLTVEAFYNKSDSTSGNASGNASGSTNGNASDSTSDSTSASASVSGNASGSTSVSGIDESYGKITTSLQNLQRDILDLRDHGVVISHSDLTDIAQFIENQYLNLPRNPIAKPTVQKKSLVTVYKSICEYIFNAEIPAIQLQHRTGTFYNIPVEEFNDLVNDNEEFKGWSTTDLRKELQASHYTKCNTGRTDNTICIESDKKDKLGKRKKVISFIEEMAHSNIKDFKDQYEKEQAKEQQAKAGKV